MTVLLPQYDLLMIIRITWVNKAAWFRWVP